MTLILTALSPQRVVQVSDRKLTYPNYSPKRSTDDQRASTEGLQRLEQGAPQRSRQEVTKELVSIIRMASHHPQYGKYIGRDCTVTALDFNEEGFLADTYKENSIEHGFPWMVNRNMVATASFSITLEDGSDAFVRKSPIPRAKPAKKE